MKILPLMLEYGGISHTEIARRIHKDEKTVRRHIQKIRKIGKQIPIIKELLYS